MGGYRTVSARDYKLDTIKDMENGEVKPTGLPESNVLYYDLTDDAWLCEGHPAQSRRSSSTMGSRALPFADADEKSAKLGEAVMAMVDSMM